MPRQRTIKCEVVVQVAGVEVYRGDSSLHCARGTEALPSDNLEAMVRGGVLKQLPTMRVKNLDLLRRAMAEAPDVE